MIEHHRPENELCQQMYIDPQICRFLAFLPPPRIKGGHSIYPPIMSKKDCDSRYLPSSAYEKELPGKCVVAKCSA